MRLSEWLDWAAARLQEAEIESALLEAQVLAAHALGQDRSCVVAHPEARAEGMDELLERRLRREPLAYIIGYREFFGRRFGVDPRVLIPRQETETLIEAALEVLPHDRDVRVLDLGTGSGCIGITLKLERAIWDVWASDCSTDALAVARRNASELGAAVGFAHSDLFESLRGERFDAVVTNPPYVNRGEKLQPEVEEWEPHVALFAGESGLAVYERLAAEAATFTDQVLAEVGDGQATVVADCFQSQNWDVSKSWRDLLGHSRVLGFRRT